MTDLRLAHDDAHDNDAAELRAVMVHAVQDLEVPAARLHAGAVRRGRAIRRTRRTVAAVSALVAAAAVVAVAVPAVSGTDAGVDTVAHEPPARPMPGATRPAGWWNMPATTMRDTIAATLPDQLSVVSTDLGDGDLAPGESPVGGWVQVALSDRGRPAGGLNVVLYPPAHDGGVFVRSRTSCPGDLETVSACHVLRDPAGAVVGRTSRWSGDGVVVLEATRLTAEGALVYAAAANSSDATWGSGSSVDRSRPALSIDQLSELVRDPAWTSWRDR